MKAIRAKCLDCCCGQYKEVALCPCTGCPLYPYRFGKNPNMRHERTQAQLEALKKGRVPFQSVDKLAGLSHAAFSEGTYTTQPTDEKEN